MREERRVKREGKEEWITLRHAVMRCAVLCCEHFLHIYIHICCSKAVTFHNVFFDSCSCSSTSFTYTDTDTDTCT